MKNINPIKWWKNLDPYYKTAVWTFPLAIVMIPFAISYLLILEVKDKIEECGRKSSR